MLPVQERPHCLLPRQANYPLSQASIETNKIVDSAVVPFQRRQPSFLEDLLGDG